MIFVNTKHAASEIQQKLDKQGVKANILIGGIDQKDRDKIMEQFRKEEFSVLISTNVLARGIDVPQVDVVVNFNVPTVQTAGWKEPDYANYMHRVGRTGRYGTDGIAITFVTKLDENEPGFMIKIAKKYSIEIKELKAFNEFEAIYKAMRNPVEEEKKE